jgi:hypothetical protein
MAEETPEKIEAETPVKKTKPAKDTPPARPAWLPLPENPA